MTPQSLAEFFRSTYAPLKLRGKSDETIRQYELQIKHFGRFLMHPPTLADLTDETVSRFLNWFRKRGHAPPTCNKARNHLLALWRLAARKRLVENFPDVAPDIEPERIPQAWMQDELQRLFDSCRQEEGEIAGVSAAAWWHALHLVAWDTGERRGALLSLKWSDVNLESGWLIVRAECRKGRRRDKAFPLHPDTIQKLREIREPKRELLFPWPWHWTWIYNRYKRLLERAGLPADRRCKFHKLRRSTASYFEAAGGDATELLDHQHRKTTRAYLDPRLIPRPDTPSRLFRPDKPISQQPPNGHQNGQKP